MDLFKKQKEVIVSFITKDKVILNQELLFVLNKDATTEMYLYPDMIQIEGKSSHSPRFLRGLKCETYDLRYMNQHGDFNTYQSYYYASLGRIKGLRSSDFSNLYYDFNDEKTLGELKAFGDKLSLLCDRLHIDYCKDPKLLMKGLLVFLDKNKVKRNELLDEPRIDFCSSKESIDAYVNEELSKCKDKRSLTNLKRSLNDYVCGADYYLVDNYCYPLLSDNYLLDAAINDKRFKNREYVIKTYMEFSILFPYVCEILDYLRKSSNGIEEKLDKIKLEELYSNKDFINELNELVNHEEGCSMHYHATTSEYDAKRILEDGLYSFSKDLSFTTYPELDLDSILLYEYGNGVNNYGNYMIVVKVPDGEEVVRDLSEDEQKDVHIMPRRASVCTPPTHVIPTKYILGYIDKVSKKFIHNESYGLDDSIKKE